ncbi:MAG TPA: elongation factor 1-beta [Methanocorpusculum sp.]|nr:elongation factor 1-beta [Methanocorpusculum sp.]
MGDVAVILKVMPESPDVNLEEMQKAIRAQVKGVNDIKVEPIGFGLSALKVAVVTQDGAGVEDVIKAQFDGIAGLESVEVEGLTLL